MIVKNEQEFLADCLESVKNVVDQIIILDTGSTDQTVNIAKRYGAEIHYFNWCDDFSVARNESIKHATSDWILWLDADERLAPDSKLQIRKEIISTKKPIIYQVQINNKTNDAASAYISTAYRLFTNNKGIAFKGRIHEQLAHDPNYPRPETRRSKLVIEHLGYAVEGELKSEKSERNLRLLQKTVEENPSSAYAHYTLGQQFSLNNEHHLAIAHFIEAKKLNQFDNAMTASLLNVLAESFFKQKDYRMAKINAQESLQKVKNQVGAYYMLYRVAEIEGDYKAAIDAVEKMITNGQLLQKNGWQISTDVIIDEDKLNYTKAVLLEKLGDNSAAFGILFKLINKTFGGEDVLNKAIPLALKLSRIPEAIYCLNKLIQINPARQDAMDTLGVIYMKQQNFPEAIKVYEKLYTFSTNNQNVGRRLAGLYLKMGDEEKAAQLLQLSA